MFLTYTTTAQTVKLAYPIHNAGELTGVILIALKICADALSHKKEHKKLSP